MKHSILSAAIIISMNAVCTGALASNYCAAIRGNGELMPAHWGAMSSIVEDRGLPQAMAGGSSASITMFLLESVSLNPLFKTNSDKALAIKSFQGYIESLSQTAEGKALASILADKSALKAVIDASESIDEAMANPNNKLLIAKHLGALKVLMASTDAREIINPDFIYYVDQTMKLSSVRPGSPAVVQYRLGQIRQALKNFGKFNAVTDKTLFFRPGLISFKKLATLFGRMANFYAGYNNDISAGGKQVEKHLSDFLQLCGPNSQALSWRELVQQRPACRQLLGGAVLTYLSTLPEEGASVKSRLFENVGQHIPAYATTSVLVNEAVQDYVEKFIQYDANADENFGVYQVGQNNLRFGYWGASSELLRIESQFQNSNEFAQDAKSQKFLSLGEASWVKVLSLSPAEPGLSRILSISREMLSAGGWSDLHPTLVLKASGCQNIIYVTRKGDESPFAQATFRRLTNASDATWSQFYDMTNPQSSMFRSQSAADQIKCTNWNGFDVRKDLSGLVEDSMRAPLVKGPLCR